MLKFYNIFYVKPEDSEELVQYLNAVGGESDNLSFGKDEFWYNSEKEKDFIESILKNKNGVILVAKDNLGSIIAESSCISNGRRSKHVFILGVTVKKEYWKSGIGTALIQRIVKECSRLGCKKVMLYVFHTNIRAIKLYYKLGFELEGILKKDAKIGNTDLNTYIMCKFL